MSIKPEYVDEIFAGRKKYEYRRIKAKRDNLDTMIIYSTSPIMKVVGEVEIITILEESPEKLWNMTKEQSGTTKEFYDNYFKNCDKAIAYKLGKVTKYSKPKDIKDFGIKNAPQSFIYIDK